MKILLTGATGFIGKNLHEHFNDGINEIMTIGRGWNLTNQIVESGGSFMMQNTKLYTEGEIQKFQPDIIIHCAAEIYKENEMIESNIVFTQWLLDATKDLNYQCFINIGSSSEYGAKAERMKETDLLEPRTMYEATKGAATLLCEANSRMYDKPIVTIRPFSVFGKHEPGHRLIPSIIRNMIKGERTIISPGYHDWIYIKDFVWGIDALLRAVKLGRITLPAVYNFGSGSQTSNQVVYECIQSLMQSNLESLPTEKYLRTFDTDRWVADTTKSFCHLDWHVQYSLMEGLREILAEKALI